MDIKMPDMDGIEAAKILTEERIAPVLLLSAYSQQDLVQRARQAGVAGYLVKPFRESDLTPAIEVALARFSEFRVMEREVSNLQDALGDAQGRGSRQGHPHGYAGPERDRSLSQDPEDEHEQPQADARSR